MFVVGRKAFDRFLSYSTLEQRAMLARDTDEYTEDEVHVLTTCCRCGEDTDGRMGMCARDYTKTWDEIWNTPSLSEM